MSIDLPDYLKIYDFDQTKLSKILSGDKIEENVDASGNHIIDSSKGDIENSLTKITQVHTKFSKEKIEQYYDTNFSEFTSPNEEMGNELNLEYDVKDVSDEHLRREAVLETQLDEMAKILEQEQNTNTKTKEDAEKTYSAMMGVIIEQRIKNGEGSNPEDFQDSFPFLPKNTTDGTTTTYESKPFASEPT